MLFQIEEPDGSPLDAEGPGVAVGIDFSNAAAGVAVAVGGNAQLLAPPAGVGGPDTAALRDGTGGFLEDPCAAALMALRGLAERALSRPVTHAVLVVPGMPSPARSAALTSRLPAS
jgi:hypothetical protein